MLSGNGGQKVYLVPSLDLIVVSTGNAFFVDSPLNEMMVQGPATRADEEQSQVITKNLFSRLFHGTADCPFGREEATIET
jgi:hypothetical protein